MAHQWMRCNLASAIFPFATELWGRSIIVPQYDQNFDRLVNSPIDKDKDKGVPQAFYMHNCLPTAQGFQAISYDVLVDPFTIPATDFNEAFPLQDPNLSRYIFVPAIGKNYVFDYVVGHWRSVNPIAGLTSDVVTTVAFINGESYIYYGLNGCYFYNTITKTIDAVVLGGLVAGDIRGITAANGYMIAWDGSAVSWSSLVDPTDFVPSLVTGAGGGGIQEAKGKIIACLPIAGGFLIYCEKNIVAAKYSGNIRFPFLFQELPGSGGIQSPEQVSWQSNLSDHFAWTTFGVQQLSLTSCKLIFPEVTDFLAAQIYEDFDEATLLLTTIPLTAPLTIKVTAISGRFVVVSYAITDSVSNPLGEFQYALVYDRALDRWGKLKITHRDCFEWNFPNSHRDFTYGDLIATTYGDLIDLTYGDLSGNLEDPIIVKKSLAFLQSDGTVQYVNFDLRDSDANGVLIIGKFQFQRNKFMVHQTTDVENVKDGDNFDMYIMSSLDGKTLEAAAACYLQNQNPLSRRYALRVTGLNLSYLYVGAFNLTSLLTNFTLGGDR